MIAIKKSPTFTSGAFYFYTLSRPEITIQKKALLWKHKPLMLDVPKKTTP